MRAQAGILIGPGHQRRGYGTAALAAVCGYCRSTLQLHQLYAHVPADNAASLALFRQCGFRTSGRLRSWLRRGGSYRDVIVLQLMFG